MYAFELKSQIKSFDFAMEAISSSLNNHTPIYKVCDLTLVCHLDMLLMVIGTRTRSNDSWLKKSNQLSILH